MNEISVIDGKRVWIYQRDSLGNNSAKLEDGLSTLFQTNFFRLFFRYCTGV